MISFQNIVVRCAWLIAGTHIKKIDEMCIYSESRKHKLELADLQSNIAYYKKKKKEIAFCKQYWFF